MNKIWITWENHRRSKELANAFNSKFVHTHSNFPSGISHLVDIFSTIKIIRKEKPEIIFVQNPSVALAAIAGWLKKIYKYKLVVDRHTNFRIGKKIGIDPRILIFTILSDSSIKNADITIVTNEYLKKFVQQKGGRAFVLPDKIPTFTKKSTYPVRGKNNIVYICTFADDEPFHEVIETANELPADTYIYITGNYKKHMDKLPQRKPKNLIFTGFLSEQKYIDLLFSADVIMDFTSLEWCLVCGGYETMAAKKPFITSNTKALKIFYSLGTIFTEHNSVDMANAINSAVYSKNNMINEIRKLKEIKEHDWDMKFRILEKLIAE